ncbi:hypothetical protein QLS31_06630 [Flavobacterium sp. XS2P24]|nr:hypothetical protein [Flavobacterium sp. XS2P24]MDI6049500.1 hypothetical protein [Flavobacterium sp. XS2P24]
MGTKSGDFAQHAINTIFIFEKTAYPTDACLQQIPTGARLQRVPTPL